MPGYTQRCSKRKYREQKHDDALLTPRAELLKSKYDQAQNILIVIFYLLLQVPSLFHILLNNNLAFRFCRGKFSLIVIPIFMIYPRFISMIFEFLQ